MHVNVSGVGVDELPASSIPFKKWVTPVHLHGELRQITRCLRVGAGIRPGPRRRHHCMEADIVNATNHKMEKVDVSDKQREEAKKIAEEREVPKGDVIHAILARDNNAILISRDKHFQLLKDICEVMKPEDII